MSSVLVIGATGNIGREVVPALTAAGAQVRAMSRNPGEARLGSKVEMVRGDLGNPESLDECTDGWKRYFLCGPHRRVL